MTRERTETVYTAGAIGAGLLFILGALITATTSGARAALIALIAVVVVSGGYALFLLRRTHRLTAVNRSLQTEHRQAVVNEADLRTQVGLLLREPVAAIVGDADLLITRHETPPDMQRALLETIRTNAHEVEAMLATLSEAATGASDAVPDIATVVVVDQEFRSIASQNPSASSANLQFEPARAWGDPAKVRQILRTLVTLSTQNGGAQLTLQTAQRGQSATATISGNGAILPAAALGALSEGERFEDWDGNTFEAMQAANNLAFGMGGSISYVQVFGDSHVLLTLPTPSSDQGTTGAGRPADSSGTHPLSSVG
jgi:signal transduction histidine kinase